MTPRFFKTGAALLALALLTILATAGWAGDSKSQSTFGSSFFSVSPPCPANQFPTFESLVPVPRIADPFVQDLIPVFCQISVTREGKPVKKVKGTFDAELIVRDNNTGDYDSFTLRSGRFKTNSEGNAGFDFELPAEIFADGFESGDVSAWSYTRTSLSNKKKADQAGASCAIGTSRSSN